MTTDRLPNSLQPPGVVVIAGPFGSGKTEIAVNLAQRWARECRTYLADLDVVTPYYRSREARESLDQAGVRLLAPRGREGVYDVPVLPADLASALADGESGLVIDVGGEPQGVGLLAHWREGLLDRKARLCLVANHRRAGAGDAAAVAALALAISEAAALPLAGIIANGNLGAATTVSDIRDGIRQARELERLLGVPVLATGCPAELTAQCAGLADAPPVLSLQLYMRPVWEPARTA